MEDFAFLVKHGLPVVRVKDTSRLHTVATGSQQAHKGIVGTRVAVGLAMLLGSRPQSLIRPYSCFKILQTERISGLQKRKDEMQPS